MATTPHTAVGVFSSRHAARDAVADLYRAGFHDNQIGLMSRYAAEFDWHQTPNHTHWEEGVGVGAATGAVTGAGLGLAVASGLVPGIGPAIAGGVLVALIASAGAGAGTGAIVGALVGLGIPEDDAAYFQREFTSGRTIVTVQAGDRYDEASAILHRRGGADDRSEEPLTSYGTGLGATPY